MSLASRTARVLGFGLFAASLFLYESPKNPRVFGRWSYPFTAIVGVVILLWLVVAVQSWISCYRHLFIPLWSKLFDFGLSFWGIGYLLGALDYPASAGRVANLGFFASPSPWGVIPEWFALLIFFFSGVTYATRKIPRRWWGPATAICTILFLLLVGEGLVRGKVVLNLETQGMRTYAEEAWIRRYVRLNRSGFRDSEHAVVATPGTRRLLVVGDSFAFGWGIRRTEDRLGEQLVNVLEKRSAPSWELINASGGNSHTLDHIEFLKGALTYQPDIVLLIYVFNDMDYIAPIVPHDEPQIRSLADRLRPATLLWVNSYLFQEVWVRARLVYYRFHRQESDPYEDPVLVRQHLSDLKRFVDLGRENGAEVWVVPFEIAITADERIRSRHRQFERAATASQIPVCSLAHAFDGYGFSQLTVNNQDAHPNEMANRLAAEVVADCVTQ